MGFRVWKATTLDQPNLSKWRRSSAGVSNTCQWGYQSSSMHAYIVEPHSRSVGDGWLRQSFHQRRTRLLSQTSTWLLDALDLRQRPPLPPCSYKQSAKSISTLGGASSLVWLVNVIDCDDCQISVIAEISERNSRSRLHAQSFDFILTQIKCDWDGEEIAVHKTFLLYHTANCKPCPCYDVTRRTRCNLARSGILFK